MCYLNWFQLLSKARGMIFDKTKMVKNQELQIDALTTQVQSLKDINQITKDLLEIRNSEVKAMEVREVLKQSDFFIIRGRSPTFTYKFCYNSSIFYDLKLICNLNRRRKRAHSYWAMLELLKKNELSESHPLIRSTLIKEWPRYASTGTGPQKKASLFGTAVHNVSSNITLTFKIF